MKLKLLITLSCVVCSFFYGSSQAGAHVYFGAINGAFEHQSLTPDGFTHPGYRIGVDGRLLEGKMYFMGGVAYSKYNLTAQDERTENLIDSDPSIKDWKYRFGLGYTLIKLPAITLRAKTMIALHDVQNHDTYDLPDALGQFNRYFGAADVGIGLDLAFLTIDLEYEHGIGNTVQDTEGTKLNVWSLTTGIFF